MVILSNVADRIVELERIKEERGLSYEDLGHELGVHSMSIYRWLRKGVAPKSRAYIRAIDQFIAQNGSCRRREGRPLTHRRSKLKGGIEKAG